MGVRSPRGLKPLSSPGEPRALEGGARHYYGGHRTRTCTGLRPAVFKTAALPVRSSPPDCSPELTRPCSSGKPVLSTAARRVPDRRGRAAGPHRIERRRCDLVPATPPWQSDV